MSHTVKWASVAAVALSVVVAGCKGGGGPFASRRKNENASNSAKLQYRTASGPSLFRREATPAAREEVAAGSTANTTGRPTRPQITCPVDAKRLGVESAPIVTVVKGEPIFVCSHACEKKVQKEPEKYLARVRAEVARRDDPDADSSRE